MKRIFNFLIPAALILSGILVGCSKDDKTPTYGAAPTLTWAANPTFEDTYLAAEMDVNLVVTAEEGIETFVVEVDSQTLTPMLSLLGIGTSMDLINDSNAIAMLSELGVPTGDQLLGKTSVNFSLSNLIPLIYALGPDAGTQHSFTLKVTDSVGQTLTQKLTFIMPESTVPTITWAANPDFTEYPLSDDMDVNITVKAPEGIAGFVIDIDSPTLNSFLLGMIGLSTSMDLINGSDSVLSTLGGLGIPVGDELKGQTEVDLDLGGLFALLNGLASSGTTHNFTLTVTDAVGQSASQTLTFTK